MADSLVIFWIGAIVVFSVIEVATVGLTTIWFAAGSLIALILATLGCNLTIQISSFIIVSIILLVFTRPLAIKHLNKKTVQTNADALIGKEGIVIKEIKDLSTGQVKVKGQVWTAIGLDETETFYEGEKIIIEKIQGVKLIIKKLK